MATITWKCPNCGGPVLFDPKTQKYKCEYCLSLFTQQQLDAQEPSSAGEEQNPEEQPVDYSENPEDLEKQRGGSGAEGDRSGESAGAGGTGESAQEGSEAVVYTCPSCGAQIVTDENTAATFCYYCHSPVVLQGRLSGRYLPDRIVPFKIDRRKAESGFLDYIKQKRFVPRAFFSKEQIEKLSGVYYPFWVYDCLVHGDMDGRATRVRVYVRGDTEFTETSVFHFEREGDVGVKNITVNALKSSDRRLIDSVQPFRMQEAEDFRMGYLQGFFAERRDMEADEAAESVRDRARELARSAVQNTVAGYTTVTPEHSGFKTEEESFSYLLLPVWVLTYGASDGKKYYFAMNGQTGETHGVLPVARGRLAAFSGLLAGIAFAAAMAVSYMI